MLDTVKDMNTGKAGLSFHAGPQTPRATTRGSSSEAHFERYMAQCKAKPVLSHPALLDLTRRIYVEHHTRFSCVMQVPSCIAHYVKIHQTHRDKGCGWGRYAAGFGDLSPEAKDRVLRDGKVVNGRIVDTSVETGAKIVAGELDTLAEYCEEFHALEDEYRLSPSPEFDQLVAQAMSIEIQNNPFVEICQLFEALSDQFRTAKLRVLSSALLKPEDHPDVSSAYDKVLLTGTDIILDLALVIDPEVSEDEIRCRVRSALRSLAALEAAHSRRCEVVLELRRQYDKALARQQRAANHVVMGNSLLAVHEILKKHHSVADEDFYDILQTANEGLAIAAYRFKYWTGCRFSTYAVFWMRNRAHKHRAGSTNVFHLPVSLMNRRMEIHRASKKLVLENGGVLPSLSAIAKECGCKVSDVEAAHAAYLPYEDLVDKPDRAHPPVTAALEQEDLRALLLKAIGRLPERHATVLRLHFGFNSGRSMTLAEIGDLLQFTTERIRTIEREAIERVLRGPYADSLAHFLTGT